MLWKLAWKPLQERWRCTIGPQFLNTSPSLRRHGAQDGGVMCLQFCALIDKQFPEYCSLSVCVYKAIFGNHIQATPVCSWNNRQSQSLSTDCPVYFLRNKIFKKIIKSYENTTTDHYPITNVSNLSCKTEQRNLPLDFVHLLSLSRGRCQAKLLDNIIMSVSWPHNFVNSNLLTLTPQTMTKSCSYWDLCHRLTQPYAYVL